MIRFDCDYLEGAHPAILQKLLDTNMDQTIGYGEDPYCAAAAEKIRKVCVNIYGAEEIGCSDEVRAKALEYTEKYPDYPICIAKTQYSFSADAKLIGAPEGFTIKITDMAVRSGAKFIVVYLNNVMTMPGLPKVPNAERIDLVDGKIVNLS